MPEGRVYKLANELRISSEKILEVCKTLRIAGKASPLASLTIEEALRLKIFIDGKRAAGEEIVPPNTPAAAKTALEDLFGLEALLEPENGMGEEGQREAKEALARKLLGIGFDELLEFTQDEAIGVGCEQVEAKLYPLSTYELKQLASSAFAGLIRDTAAEMLRTRTCSTLANGQVDSVLRLRSTDVAAMRDVVRHCFEKYNDDALDKIKRHARSRLLRDIAGQVIREPEYRRRRRRHLDALRDKYLAMTPEALDDLISKGSVNRPIAEKVLVDKLMMQYDSLDSNSLRAIAGDTSRPVHAKAAQTVINRRGASPSSRREDEWRIHGV